jgi:hypothetical protein
MADAARVDLSPRPCLDARSAVGCRELKVRQRTRRKQIPTGPSDQTRPPICPAHRALSVAIPVFAYICRYNFESKTNAIRARMVGVTCDRAQMRRRL